MLYIVATPIGNLGDISARALKTLGEVDFIAAEDTRVTRKLLSHFNIKKTLVSYYQHNMQDSGEKIVKRLIDGESCALVSDAGTPGISDPGEKLVAMCLEAGISIISIPGPCAAISALTLSGLPAGRFSFEGFLSTARKSRFERLAELKNETRTMVFYEAPHKLMRTLSDFLTVFGDRNISISREMTKIYEETLRLTLSGAIAHFTINPPIGEFVLILEGAQEEDSSRDAETELAAAKETALALIENGTSVKDAVKITANDCGIPKNALYDAVVSYFN